MPITWRHREPFACSNCNQSHSGCIKNFDNGELRDCVRCTERGYRCEYPAWARKTYSQYPVSSQPVGDQLVHNQSVPVVAESTVNSDCRSVAQILPQHSTIASDADHTRAYGVDLAYTNESYYSGARTHATDNVQPPDEGHQFPEIPGAGPLSMVPLHGQGQGKSGIVVAEAIPVCLCFDTYPFRCAMHDRDDSFYTRLTWPCNNGHVNADAVSSRL